MALSKRLSKSLYTKRWQALRVILKDLRKEAGLTQADVGRRLDRPQSLVAKIEAGERKLDVCHFIDYVRLLGGDPIRVMRQLCK